jgi:hypothetical protein
MSDKLPRYDTDRSPKMYIPVFGLLHMALMSLLTGDCNCKL